MRKNSHRATVGLIIALLPIIGLTGCPSENSAILLDGAEADPTKAEPMFTAKPGVDVTLQADMKGGGSWSKVTINQKSVWIDSGYLQCDQRTPGASCKIK
ncbi:hypothetical protein ACKFKF_24730 [Phormidesmis sp. 146-12]